MAGISRLRVPTHLGGGGGCAAVAHYSLAFAQVSAGHPREALESTEHALRLSPYDPMMHGFLTLKAGILLILGRPDAARAAMQQAQALQPDVSLRWLRARLPLAPGVDIEPYFDAMRKAGLPD